ncbi:MAG: hypothetical protein IT357_17175 [Gemmatimonadaceae bacterium]|nr:hypothetical protein [Gemmatimonadaceae bacterium]
MSRARVGFDSDRSGRRAPWVIGGAIVLAVGGLLAAVAVAVALTPLVTAACVGGETWHPLHRRPRAHHVGLVFLMERRTGDPIRVPRSFRIYMRGAGRNRTDE